MTAEAPQNIPTESPVISEGWESERDTERAKISIRWMGIIILLSVVLWLRADTPAISLSNTLIAIIAGCAAVMTVCEMAFLWRPGVVEIPSWFKYVTVFGDMAFISTLIYYTGGTRSPFFFVYFVFLISNCLRYGLKMSLFVALMFNILYAVVLGLAPASEHQASVLGGEGLKILAFWATAFYGGSVSERLRRQATQLRVYEETLLELRARLRMSSLPAANSAPPTMPESVPVPSEGGTTP